MKTKIFVGYSTNRDDKFIKRFNKEIIKSSGLKNDIVVVPFKNNGEYSLTKSYNILIDTLCKEIYGEGFDGKTFYDDFPPTEYLCLFIHHDIHFKSQAWGKNLLNIFNNNDVDIVGVAGTDHLRNHGVWWLNESGQMDQNNLWGKVWHTDGKKEWKSDFTGPNKKCQKVQPVAAIDGVFMAFNPDTCHKFDEDFGGFHMYDISFCVENHLYGKNIAVTETIQLIHESGGQLSTEWDENRKRLCYIYESYLPVRAENEKEERKPN